MHTGYRLKGDVKNEKITLWDLPHCYHIILTNLFIPFISRVFQASCIINIVHAHN